MKEEDYKYKIARERVEEKRKFRKHLSTYMTMSLFFLVLNMVTRGRLWAHWPIIGWGIGVLMHYFKAYGLPGLGVDDPAWEAREMEKEMRRLDPQRKTASTEEELELPDLKDEPEKEPEKRWRDEDLV